MNKKQLDKWECELLNEIETLTYKSFTIPIESKEGKKLKQRITELHNRFELLRDAPFTIDLGRNVRRFELGYEHLKEGFNSTLSYAHTDEDFRLLYNLCLSHHERVKHHWKSEKAVRLGITH